MSEALLERKLIARRQGYELWRERSLVEFDVGIISDPNPDGSLEEFAEQIDGRHIVEVEIAYTPDGAYIGNEKTAEFLIHNKGIMPELMLGAKVCSIGFCERERKWYGWSHRAIYGFKIGDVAKEGDCVCSSGWLDDYLAEHPEKDLSLPVGFEAKTLDDCKRMAIAFAESVG